MLGFTLCVETNSSVAFSSSLLRTQVVSSFDNLSIVVILRLEYLLIKWEFGGAQFPEVKLIAIDVVVVFFSLILSLTSHAMCF